MNKQELLKNEGWLPIFKGWYGNDFFDDKLISELEFYNIEHYKTDIYQKSYYTIIDDCINQANINIFEAVKDELKELGLITDMVFEKMVSPKEYNYKNDSINCR